MKKLTLSDWAAIAEIVGAAAVVISLLVVAQSINRNTAMLEVSKEGEFLEAWRNTVQMPFATNERLAEIQLKVHNGEALEPVEELMWENSLRALFDVWAQYYGAYKQGLVSYETWAAWNESIATFWERERMGDFWRKMRVHWNGTEFQKHIDQEASKRPSGNEH